MGILKNEVKLIGQTIKKIESLQNEIETRAKEVVELKTKIRDEIQKTVKGVTISLVESSESLLLKSKEEEKPVWTGAKIAIAGDQSFLLAYDQKGEKRELVQVFELPPKWEREDTKELKERFRLARLYFRKVGEK